MSLPCTEEVGMIKVGYATPEGSRKSSKRMEVSIIDSMADYSMQNEDECHNRNIVYAEI
jgi:hypothetical protein